MFTIYNGMPLASIQNAFNTAFPYLKLEFFKQRHQAQDGSAKKDMIEPGGLLLAKSLRHAQVTVTGQMQVAALEQLFSEQYGLSAQVFRKSGKTWLETTLTDDWSLDKQNNEGCELSAFGT